jgi:N-acetylneuraminate synthase
MAAVAMGATSLERHITLNKTMYGSDQPASLEIGDFLKLVSEIRELEISFGDGIKQITPSEIKILQKLRK